jgi:ABC-type glycerol-3-phosphate transport system substrate-binding protein
LAACGGAPPASPTAAPKAAEPTKPAAAPAATTAPAAKPAEATKPAAQATTAPAAAPTAAAAPKPAGKEVELTLGLVSEWDMVGWDKLLNEVWYKQNPNIKIKYFLQPPQTWAQTLQTQFSGGAGPDVFFIWGNTNQDWWNSDLKFSLDITDEINKDTKGWGVRDEIRKSLRGNDGERDFQIALRLETAGIWFNQEAFKKAGITPPAQTPKIQKIEWATFMDWCKALKGAGYIPLSTTAFRSFIHPTILEYDRTFAKWVEIYVADSKLRYGELPEVKEAWQAWIDLYKTGYLPDGMFGLGVPEQRALWVQQKAAMTLDGHWMWRDFGQKTKEAGFTYGILPPPTAVPNGPFPHAIAALDSFAANRATKLKDESVAFLKFLAAPATQEWMTENWRNISVSPGVAYKEPETATFAQMLEKNLMFKSLASAFGNEVQTTWDAQVEPVSTGKITVDQALAAIQKKIDEAVAKRKK